MLLRWAVKWHTKRPDAKATAPSMFALASVRSIIQSAPLLASNGLGSYVCGGSERFRVRELAIELAEKQSDFVITTAVSLLPLLSRLKWLTTACIHSDL